MMGLPVFHSFFIKYGKSDDAKPTKMLAMATAFALALRKTRKAKV